MHMHLIDWLILGGLIVALFGILFYCNRYVKNAADFLSASRCGGRYVLCISQGIAAIGAISIVATFEKFYKVGFVPIYWAMMNIPITLALAMTAFVTYRFRETRCFTKAQFFELRYSKRFRIFAGLLAWFAGVLNYALFPAVSARFFIFFCGLPDVIYSWNKYLTVCGRQYELCLATYPVLLAIILFCGCFFAIRGGQVAIMVTDFAQGIFGMLTFLVLLIFLFLEFDWITITEALALAPAGQSLVNPFKTGAVEDFNFWFYAIAALGAVYSAGSWQGGSGYASAARNPHEMRMAGLLGNWRGQAQTLVLMLIPIACYTVLNHPHFADLAGAINGELDQITNPQLRKQMTPIMAVTKMLPAGMLGLFAAMMFAAMLSTDDTYLHSWGSIFIQDVILPFRRKPFTPQQHIRYLQLSIIFVAVFAFGFSCLYRQTEYILMFFAITGAIYLGGAGSVLIGGLYWKKGTTAAAWGSLSIGSVLAVTGIACQQHEALGFELPACLADGEGKLRWNSQWIYLFGIAASALTYVVVSLLTCRRDFNLDKLMHRGKYDTHGEHATVQVKIFDWKRLGVNDEFTLNDKILYWATQAWSLGWLGFFAGTVVWQYCVAPTTDEFWKAFWHFKVWLAFVLGCVTTVWFLLGGLRDVKALFVELINLSRNDADDGRVVGDHSAGEYAGVESTVVREARDDERRPEK